jgi:cytosine deaminase
MEAPAIPSGQAYVLRNATVARTLLAQPQRYPGDGETVLLDIAVERGRIARVAPADSSTEGAPVDLDAGMAWPCFTDIHTHLDKGHIWPRSPNPDGRHASARLAVAADRTAHWSADDVAARMRFGLRCAYAHGSRAVRTHIDSYGGQGEKSWPVLAAMRAEWEGRIALQGVSLIAVEAFRDEEAGARLADLVARFGGILGAATTTEPDLDLLLDRVFALAQARDLDLDFHVDETNDPQSRSLAHIARAAIKRRFAARIVVGHCCSLALQPAEEADRTMDLVAAAGIAVVSLPMCNLYLMDRGADRTPRWRGVTLLHELAARGKRQLPRPDLCLWRPRSGRGLHPGGADRPSRPSGRRVAASGHGDAGCGYGNRRPHCGRRAGRSRAVPGAQLQRAAEPQPARPDSVARRQADRLRAARLP